MSPNLAMLKGLALQQDTGSSRTVKLSSVKQLPKESAASLRALMHTVIMLRRA